MNEIVVENEGYRILKKTSGAGSCLGCDFYSNKRTRIRLKMGSVAAVLEEKRSMFIFFHYWHRIEFTNLAYVVDEWMHKYFKGIRLNNKTDDGSDD